MLNFEQAVPLLQPKHFQQLKRLLVAGRSAGRIQYESMRLTGSATLEDRVHIFRGLRGGANASQGVHVWPIASANSTTPVVRNLLTAEQSARWSSQLDRLSELLFESGAADLGAVIYASDETLICEIGKPGRTLSIALDDEGSTISYRQKVDDFNSYKSVSWDSLPELGQFTTVLSTYRNPEQSAWINKTKRTLSIMNSLDAGFATNLAATSLSMTGQEASLYFSEPFSRTE